MRKFLLFLISLLIGTGLFYWVVRTVGWQEIRNSFLVFSGWQGLAIFSLTVLTTLIGSWKWQEVLKGMGVRISFLKIWQAYLAGFSIRYLSPMVIIGSEIFQGRILKETALITWEKSMASVIVDRVLELTASLAVIFFGLSFFLFKIGLLPMKLAFIFGGVIILLAALIFYFYFKSFKRESIAKAIGRLFNRRLDAKPLEIEKEIFIFFKIKKATLWKSFILSFVRAGIMWFRAWILVLFLGKSLGALSALSILGFYYLASMIPIPAGLGSHEVIQAFAFSSLGISAGAGMAFALIIRGAEISVSLLGIIILFRLGLELMKNTLFRKAEKLSGNLVSNKKEP